MLSSICIFFWISHSKCLCNDQSKGNTRKAKAKIGTLEVHRICFVLDLLYSAKFSQVFNFANFCKFSAVSMKIFDTQRAVCACSEFTKLFQQIIQNSLFAKI